MTPEAWHQVESCQGKVITEAEGPINFTELKKHLGLLNHYES